MEHKINYTHPWTSEERYRPYKSYSRQYYDNLKKSVATSLFNNTYHIQPKTGLLNDPNGFCYFNNKYHLFYQLFPYGPVHGLKCWGLMTSSDLIHWQDDGIKLFPDTVYDSHGVYSGSALPLPSDDLFLFYTGNTRGKDQFRAAFQNGALLNSSGNIKKLDLPLLTTPEGYSENFRDPMIFKYNDETFAVIGAQTLSNEGKIVLVHAADDTLNSWIVDGPLNFTEDVMGYMIECPNLIFIGQQPLLIFCPQGLDKTITHYDNIFPNMYVIGESFDPSSTKLVNTSKLQTLDDGFEIYATQAFNAPDGRVLAVSWLGLPDLDVPTQADGWQGMLSLVKELSLKNDKLYQYPVSETLSLRQQLHKLTLSRIPSTINTNSYELEVHFSSNNTLYLFANADKTNYISLSVDMKQGILTLNREMLPNKWSESHGYERSTQFDNTSNNLKLNIFSDTSSLEIFINDGEKVMSNRIFSDPSHTFLFTNSNVSAKIWHLKK